MKTPLPESLFNKIVGLQSVTLFKKETPVQMSSFKLCQFFKNFFIEKNSSRGLLLIFKGFHWGFEDIFKSIFIQELLFFSTSPSHKNMF